MFEQMLRDAPDEEWEVFYPVDDHWPSAEQMASYQVLRDTLVLLLLCSALVLRSEPDRRLMRKTIDLSF